MNMPNITPNKVATYAAIGLAAFAVVYILRKPAAGPVAAQPAVQRQGQILADWTQTLLRQESEFGRSIYLAQPSWSIGLQDFRIGV